MAAKDMAKNELIVVQGHDHPLLLRDRLSAQDLAWVERRAARSAPRLRRPRRATARPTRPAGSRRPAWTKLRGRIRRAAVGGDAGAVGGAVPGRGVPRRRRDPVGRARLPSAARVSGMSELTADAFGRLPTRRSAYEATPAIRAERCRRTTARSESLANARARLRAVRRQSRPGWRKSSQPRQLPQRDVRQGVAVARAPGLVRQFRIHRRQPAGHLAHLAVGPGCIRSVSPRAGFPVARGCRHRARRRRAPPSA